MPTTNPDVWAIILAGGPGERLNVLSEHRAIPAVPFAGKYRIIDFVLSNCVNSGLDNLMVLTQYQPLSLHQHIGNGKPWDLDRLRGGVRVVAPYQGRKEAGWDRGTAHAVYQNLEEIYDLDTDLVLILGGDHIYKMDYRPLIDFHLQNKADVTVGIIRAPLEDAHRFGIVGVDDAGRVTTFEEKPTHPTDNLVSMGIYVFNKNVLTDRLLDDAATPNSQHDFGRNVIPQMLAAGDQVWAYLFEGYWEDIGTVEAYWQANMGLLDDQPALDLYERSWVVYTRSEERAPATVGANAQLEQSLISHGCQINGQVIHSVLSPGVVVEEGAVVRDSIILTDTVIGRNSRVERVVIDKEVVIDPDSQIGQGDDLTPNRAEPERLSSGVTLIGKRAHLPAGITVGRNCKIGPDVKPEDFSGLNLASGETVEAKGRAG